MVEEEELLERVASKLHGKLKGKVMASCQKESKEVEERTKKWIKSLL